MAPIRKPLKPKRIPERAHQYRATHKRGRGLGKRANAGKLIPRCHHCPSRSREESGVLSLYTCPPPTHARDNADKPGFQFLPISTMSAIIRRASLRRAASSAARFA
jgi:hypothetical protein